MKQKISPVMTVLNSEVFTFDNRKCDILKNELYDSQGIIHNYIACKNDADAWYRFCYKNGEGLVKTATCSNADVNNNLFGEFLSIAEGDISRLINFFRTTGFLIPVSTDEYEFFKVEDINKIHKRIKYTVELMTLLSKFTEDHIKKRHEHIIDFRQILSYTFWLLFDTTIELKSDQFPQTNYKTCIHPILPYIKHIDFDREKAVVNMENSGKNNFDFDVFLRPNKVQTVKDLYTLGGVCTADEFLWYHFPDNSAIKHDKTEFIHDTMYPQPLPIRFGKDNRIIFKSSYIKGLEKNYKTYFNELPYMPNIQDAWYLYRHSSDFPEKQKRLIDFLYHFSIRFNSLKFDAYKFFEYSEQKTGMLKEKEFVTPYKSIEEEMYDKFDEPMCMALLDIARQTVKEEIDSAVAQIVPTYNIENGTGTWSIPNLITAMYFSIFCRNGEIAFRRCKNPNCNMYFEVSKTNNKKQFCTDPCRNRYHQNIYKSKKKND